MAPHKHCTFPDCHCNLENNGHHRCPKQEAGKLPKDKNEIKKTNNN